MKKIFYLLTLLLCSSFFTSQAYGARWKAKHVVFIGLDGWGSYSVDKARMPRVKALMENGCYTLEKRTVLPSSSAVNWASIFMGAGPELHGYTEWGSKVPELKSRTIGNYGIFPNIWGLMRDRYPDARTGYFYEWDGMRYVADTAAISHSLFVGDAAAHPGRMSQEASAYIRAEQPALVGIIFDEPDHVGHGPGHDTPDYYEKLNQLDTFIGEIIDATKAAGIYDDTIFIVTSDHGGINTGHGGKTMEEMETPFIISGKNIRKGGEFTESMMQYDVASTLAYIFRIEQPQVWIGRPMKQVFR